MIPSPSKLSLCVALSALGLGCTPVEGQDDAARGLRAMLVALGPGPANVFPDPVSIPRSTAFRSSDAPPAGAFVLDGTDISCPGDGKFRLDGYVTGDEEVSRLHGPDSRAFEFEVKFRRCSVDGVKLGGEIDYSLAASLGPTPEEPSFAWRYTGEVVFRGETEGRCEIDMEASGDTFESLRDVEARNFSGTVCGFDAEEIAALAELEGVLAPRP